MSDRDNAGRFVPGHASKGGRPKGSRNMLGEAFVAALYDDFQQHGVGVIEAVRVDDPSTYLRVVAGILPKELEIKQPLGDMSDAELANAIELVRAALVVAVDGNAGGSADAAGAEPAQDLSALH